MTISEKPLSISDIFNDYKAVFEQLQAGVHIYQLEDINDDSTLRMVSANQAAADLTGVAVRDLVGKTLDENFPGLREIGIPQKYAAVVRSQEPAELGDVSYSDDRVILVFFAVRAFPLPDNCVGVLFENVTERRKAEEELAKSRAQLQALFENMISAFAYHQILTNERGEPVDYIFLEVNKSFEQFTGLNREDLIGRRVTEVHPDIESMEFDWIGTYGKVALTGEPIIFEQYFKPQNKWYLISAYCPQIGYFALTFDDITEKKGVEEEHRKREIQLTALVDNMIDPIVVTDMNGLIRFVNNAACIFFGRETDDLLGSELGLPVDLSTIFEITAHPPNAEMRYAEAKSTLIDWNNEQSFLLSLRDITARKLAIEEREKSNAQMQQAQRMESIGNLAGGVAHDFNNMLSVILGYGQELVHALESTPLLCESAQEIVIAGKRSAELTRQLLAFSRRQTLQTEVLDLNDIVLNLEKVLRRLIEEHIELETFLTKGLALVKVDPGQIEQVVVNLAVNARDAMPEGGRLTIETENVEINEQYSDTHLNVIPGRYAMLSISDDGCGMDQETQKRIFEPFFTTKERGKGTGLGLSTVYGIIKQSGGYIWVYSEPGQGTTFKIYLPESLAELSEKIPLGKIDTIEGKGEMILIVEDEPSLRKLCERILTSLNYKVTLATNGKEAMALIKERELCPDLIITDVVMPEMNGPVLIERLQKILPDLKYIYMSGYTNKAIIDQEIIHSGIPFIQKPFSKDKIGEAIRSVLNEA